ncbi:MAG: ABC transporter ATP-binding protein, partial [Gammaproteobacteria bacterium]|nr:ABC transporter ATP-binding protein [Gammaproteobacteria bacterium]
SIMILDEPTNHIDLQGREQLEEQLVEADVTLLVTSHDKHFLQTVCTKYWAIRDNRLREISHIDEFYTQLASQYLDSPQTETVERNVEVLNSNQGLDEDLALVRIGELEDLLRADKLRKVKFQKPKLQQQWQVELNALWKVLEDST